MAGAGLQEVTLSLLLTLCTREIMRNAHNAIVAMSGVYALRIARKTFSRSVAVIIGDFLSLQYGFLSPEILS